MLQLCTTLPLNQIFQKQRLVAKATPPQVHLQHNLLAILHLCNAQCPVEQLHQKEQL